jgi:hypothetical protein
VILIGAFPQKYSILGSELLGIRLADCFKVEGCWATTMKFDNKAVRSCLRRLIAEMLELMCFMDSVEYWDDMNEVIAQLACRHHLETLQEIKWGHFFVDGDESPIPMALETFFCTRSTNLKMLRLLNVEIDAECCNHLFGKWQTSYAARAETVILEDCVFTYDGSECFGKLMESSRQREILRGGKSGCGNVDVVNVHLEMSESANAAGICALQTFSLLPWSAKLTLIWVAIELYLVSCPQPRQISRCFQLCLRLPLWPEPWRPPTS